MGSIYDRHPLTYSVECIEQRTGRYISDLWSFFKIHM